MKDTSSATLPILRIGVFFDGTGNNRHNSAHAGPSASGSYANAPSNIALLHDLYPQGPAELPDGSARTFIKLYVAGIGTAEGESDATYEQMTGRGATGVAARAAQAQQAIAEHLHSWREVNPEASMLTLEFDLFGFSRGAAAARHLANALCSEGQGRLNFIGLFDTVAAIVAPLEGNFSPANARYSGLKLALASNMAAQVVQLVAGDERRHNFPLVRTDQDIVLPGAHSDIGGGYPPRVQEKVMLCKPRSSREPQGRALEQSAAYKALSAQPDNNSAQIITWEAPLIGTGAKPAEREKRVFAAWYREREVLGDLSRIYLSIMRELAVRGGVPFAPVDLRSLPQELDDISRKLHDFATGRNAALGLTEAEQALLQSRYVHASAHWNPAGGLRSSELDVLFINRPGQAGRVLHGNC
ncbi:hypothetical protein J2W83_004009 [Pseudomonas hunanensis]|uniref:Uncharacterized protein n=1 Tax=Pseudomonas hunanensis TaxID=1247546 RepID=A0ACC6K7D3_9PSED|nr:DUF2235 domain-containing protein [Pseudomonas hunanensis]MDR6714388.1 hypothetical protein [Pseudomonas hunanensis]